MFDVIMSVTVLQLLEARRVAPSAQICEIRFISNGIGYDKFSAVPRIMSFAFMIIAGHVIETHEHTAISKSGERGAKKKPPHSEA